MAGVKNETGVFPVQRDLDVKLRGRMVYDAHIAKAHGRECVDTASVGDGTEYRGGRRARPSRRSVKDSLQRSVSRKRCLLAVLDHRYRLEGQRFVELDTGKGQGRDMLEEGSPYANAEPQNEGEQRHVEYLLEGAHRSKE